MAASYPTVIFDLNARSESSTRSIAQRKSGNLTGKALSLLSSIPLVSGAKRHIRERGVRVRRVRDDVFILVVIPFVTYCGDCTLAMVAPMALRQTEPLSSRALFLANRQEAPSQHTACKDCKSNHGYQNNPGLVAGPRTLVRRAHNPVTSPTQTLLNVQHGRTLLILP